MTDRERVQEITALARGALSAGETGEVDLFVEKVQVYLAELEVWQKEAGERNPLGESSGLTEQEKEGLRSSLSELSELHQKLMGDTEQTKDEVGAAMGDMHRKASGLRKYVDTLPGRISITGKRKG